MKHIHKITFRGTLDIISYNKVLRLLYDNSIKYKTFSTYSKTRDDAGLLIYFDSIVFVYDKYIPYYTNRKRISIKELIDKVRKEEAVINKMRKRDYRGQLKPLKRRLTLAQKRRRRKKIERRKEQRQKLEV